MAIKENMATRVFRDYQDKVEERMGVRPLNEIQVRAREAKRKMRNKYKNPRNDLKEKLLRTKDDKEESRKSIMIDLSDEDIQNIQEYKGNSRDWIRSVLNLTDEELNDYLILNETRFLYGPNGIFQERLNWTFKQISPMYNDALEWFEYIGDKIKDRMD